MIREVRNEDAGEITEIYNHYILNTTVTFEVAPLTVGEMERRIEDISSAYPYMVYEQDGYVVGYCYVHQWHERAAFQGVVELSVYLSPASTGHGIGKELMHRMIRECRRRGYRVLIGCVTGGNDVSRAIHTKMGFVEVGHFPDVGLKFGRLIDIYYYQLPLQSMDHVG